MRPVQAYPHTGQPGGRELQTARVEVPRGGIVRTPKLILTVIGLLGSAAAMAGPFCMLVDGMAPNCRFYDEASCAQAAVAANGGCVENRLRGTRLATPLAVAPKDAGYCLMGHGDAKCYYFDAQACAKAAQLEGGTCLTRSRLSTPLH
jgi:hypothetical protein